MLAVNLNADLRHYLIANASFLFPAGLAGPVTWFCEGMICIIKSLTVAHFLGGPPCLGRRCPPHHNDRHFASRKPQRC
jgi:hypothetical protein